MIMREAVGLENGGESDPMVFGEVWCEVWTIFELYSIILSYIGFIGGAHSFMTIYI